MNSASLVRALLEADPSPVDPRQYLYSTLSVEDVLREFGYKHERTPATRLQIVPDARMETHYKYFKFPQVLNPRGKPVNALLVIVYIYLANPALPYRIELDYKLVQQAPGFEAGLPRTRTRRLIVPYKADRIRKVLSAVENVMRQPVEGSGELIRDLSDTLTESDQIDAKRLINRYGLQQNYFQELTSLLYQKAKQMDNRYVHFFLDTIGHKYGVVIGHTYFEPSKDYLDALRNLVVNFYQDELGVPNLDSNIMLRCVNPTYNNWSFVIGVGQGSTDTKT